MVARNRTVVSGEDVPRNPLWGGAKNQDPFGRIIHDYSSPSPNKNSVNSALINTSVKYISFVARARQLSKVDWFVKGDL